MNGHASTFQRRLTTLALAATLALATATAAVAAPGGAKGKSYVCHATGNPASPWALLHISNAALKAHTRHGDYVVTGPTAVCGSDVVDTDFEQ